MTKSHWTQGYHAQASYTTKMQVEMHMQGVPKCEKGIGLFPVLFEDTLKVIYDKRVGNKNIVLLIHNVFVMATLYYN